MSRRISGAMAAILVVLAVAGGLALVAGLSPGEYLPGSDDGDSAPGADDSTTADGSSDATTAGASDPPSEVDAGTPTRGTDSRYDFAIERVESCGTTCRNVTARLANEGSESREDVQVTTAIYADGDLLWRGNETVSRLAGGETHISTRRVTLGFGDAMTIQNNDGYVTIVTSVRSPDGVVRFEDRREVA